MPHDRRLERLSRGQSLDLLGSVPLGRLVFTHQALPAVRPVNHLVEGETVIVRTAAGTAITSATQHTGVVVAYEADVIDMAAQTGWSVIIVGTARLLADEDAAERYRARLHPWLSGPRDEVITISADLVTGYRMVPEGAAGVPAQGPGQDSREARAGHPG